MASPQRRNGLVSPQYSAASTSRSPTTTPGQAAKDDWHKMRTWSFPRKMSVGSGATVSAAPYPTVYEPQVEIVHARTSSRSMGGYYDSVPLIGARKDTLPDITEVSSPTFPSPASSPLIGASEFGTYTGPSSVVSSVMSSPERPSEHVFAAAPPRPSFVQVLRNKLTVRSFLLYAAFLWAVVMFVSTFSGGHLGWGDGGADGDAFAMSAEAPIEAPIEAPSVLPEAFATPPTPLFSDDSAADDDSIELHIVDIIDDSAEDLDGKLAKPLKGDLTLEELEFREAQEERAAERRRAKKLAAYARRREAARQNAKRPAPALQKKNDDNARIVRKQKIVPGQVKKRSDAPDAGPVVAKRGPQRRNPDFLP